MYHLPQYESESSRKKFGEVQTIQTKMYQMCHRKQKYNREVFYGVLSNSQYFHWARASVDAVFLQSLILRGQK